MNDLARVTAWLPTDEYFWLKCEKERLDSDPSGDFKCRIVREDNKIALFYNKIYFHNGEMLPLPQHDRIEDKP